MTKITINDMMVGAKGLTWESAGGVVGTVGGVVIESAPFVVGGMVEEVVTGISIIINIKPCTYVLTVKILQLT